MDNFYILLLCISHFSVWYLSSICSNFKWMKVVNTLKETIQIIQRSYELSQENYDILKRTSIHKDTVKELEKMEARLKRGN